MERIVDVAQYIYNEYKKLSGLSIDEMKLHKLLYFTQRECYSVKGEPMFEESFEAWKYGPVSREVGSCFTEEGLYSDDINEISLENKYIAKNVVMQYGILASWKLSELSHKEISWKNARKGLPEGSRGSNIMLLEDIKKDAEKVRPYDSLWDMYYDEFETAEEIQ